METVLNMLALIDNPMQDIPLAGVLKSPIGGMKDRELAIVMAEFKKDPDRGEDVGFYGAVKRYLEKHGESEEDAVIYRKLAAFQNLLTTLREESMYLPVSRLIYRIFDLTGYDNGLLRRRHAGRKDEAGEPRHAGAESGRLREDQLSGTFRFYPLH